MHQLLDEPPPEPGRPVRALLSALFLQCALYEADGGVAGQVRRRSGIAPGAVDRAHDAAHRLGWVVLGGQVPGGLGGRRAQPVVGEHLSPDRLEVPVGSGPVARPGTARR